MKWKYLMIVIALFFTLLGCSQETTNMYVVSHSEVTEKVEGIEFEYQLPSKLPFELVNIGVSHPPSNQPIFTVDYIGGGEKHISLDVANAEVNQISPMEEEEVEIGNSTGKFFENRQGAKILTWKEDGVSYQLSTSHEKEIGKSELITVAESFK